MIAYSIEVAPDSSLKKLMIVRMWINSALHLMRILEIKTCGILNTVIKILVD
jgi:hypothetical protein